MAFPLAAASFALSAGSSIASFLGGRSAARAQNNHARVMNDMQMAYRYEVMRYQNDTWKQDLDHANEVLSYSKDEFGKQIEWAQLANAAVEQNRNADAFTLMARGIEETIASTFQATGIARQGQAARSTFQARERGVEGNSTDAVLGDIWRQEGEAATMNTLNRENTLRQLEHEGLAQDAQADQQMFQIASSIRTFAPNAPIRAPSPVSPVQPTAPVTGPSVATLAAGLGNAAITGFNTYSSVSGQNAQQTWNQLSSWAGRQFTIGGRTEPASNTPLAPGVG